MTKILVCIPVDGEERAKLEAAAPDAVFSYKEAKTLAEGDVDDVDIIFGNIPFGLVESARKLSLMQLFTAGTDGYLERLSPSCAITNTTGAFGLAISEHMLAMLMMLEKRLHQYRDNQAKRVWLDRGEVTSVESSTVVVLGLGDIGGEFARKCKALGAYTIGVRRADAKKPDYIDEIVLSDDMDKVLPRADVVAMALPASPATVHILDRRRIGLLKEGCIVLNVGRGTAIDQEALADAIETRGLRAGLDVTDPEPLPEDSRLWGLENCLITPHISGFFHLKATKDRMVGIAAENIRRHLAGEKLINIIDRSTGYRADKYDGGKDIIK